MSMRTSLSLVALVSAASVPSMVRADPPRVEVCDAIVITARGPEAFTTISRARIDHDEAELRAHLVREVPRTVRRDPF